MTLKAYTKFIFAFLLILGVNFTYAQDKSYFVEFGRVQHRYRFIDSAGIFRANNFRMPLDFAIGRVKKTDIGKNVISIELQGFTGFSPVWKNASQYTPNNQVGSYYNSILVVKGNIDWYKSLISKRSRFFIDAGIGIETGFVPQFFEDYAERQNLRDSVYRYMTLVNSSGNIVYNEKAYSRVVSPIYAGTRGSLETGFKLGKEKEVRISFLISGSLGFIPIFRSEIEYILGPNNDSGITVLQSNLTHYTLKFRVAWVPQHKFNWRFSPQSTSP